jgi:hypothetical protein
MKILLYTDLFVYNSFDPGLFFFWPARPGARGFPCTPDSFLYREPGSFQFALIKHRALVEGAAFSRQEQMGVI